MQDYKVKQALYKLKKMLTEQEIELFKIISDNYYEQGKEIIDSILSENPYNDTLLG